MPAASEGLMPGPALDALVARIRERMPESRAVSLWSALQRENDRLRAQFKDEQARRWAAEDEAADLRRRLNIAEDESRRLKRDMSLALSGVRPAPSPAKGVGQIEPLPAWPPYEPELTIPERPKREIDPVGEAELQRVMAEEEEDRAADRLNGALDRLRDVVGARG